MAYTRKTTEKCPLPVEPNVLCVYVPNTSAESNILIDIPWKRCELVHAYTVCVTAVDATGAMEIDLELNAAGGTEMMTAQVAASSSVGDQDDFSVTTAAACKNLSRDESARDKINIEVDGSTEAAGAVMLFMYFESYRG